MWSCAGTGPALVWSPKLCSAYSGVGLPWRGTFPGMGPQAVLHLPWHGAQGCAEPALVEPRGNMGSALTLGPRLGKACSDAGSDPGPCGHWPLLSPLADTSLSGPIIFSPYLDPRSLRNVSARELSLTRCGTSAKSPPPSYASTYITRLLDGGELAMTLLACGRDFPRSHWHLGSSMCTLVPPES